MISARKNQEFHHKTHLLMFFALANSLDLNNFSWKKKLFSLQILFINPSHLRIHNFSISLFKTHNESIK